MLHSIFFKRYNRSYNSIIWCTLIFKCTFMSCRSWCNKICFITKKKFKKAKLICTRWSYDKINNTWNLVDGIPCKTCMKYIISKMENIKEIIISRKDGLHTMNINEALKLTRLSTWVLYGT